MENASISIIVPVYQNEGSLIPTYKTICAAFSESNNEVSDIEFIFVDDGSTDNSLNELIQLNHTYDNVRIIKLSKNFGQFSALNAGLHYSKGNYVLSISADQQDPPSILINMIGQLLAGHDIALARRQSRKDSFIKNITAAAHLKLIRMSTPNYPVGGFDCWGLSRKAVDAYKKYNDIIRTNQVDILQLGYKTAIVEYDRLERKIGRSQYNFKKRLKVSLNQILTTSSWPLRMTSFIGIMMTIIAFIYGARVLYAYFYKGMPFVGYTPIILLQLLIGGLIMGMLGVIGEYQWRIYFEAKKRPLYFIDEIYD